MTKHLFTKRTRPASFTRLASGKTSGTGSEAALARGHRQPLVSALTFVKGAERGMLDSCANGLWCGGRQAAGARQCHESTAECEII